MYASGTDREHPSWGNIIVSTREAIQSSPHREKVVLGDSPGSKKIVKLSRGPDDSTTESAIPSKTALSVASTSTKPHQPRIDTTSSDIGQNGQNDEDAHALDGKTVLAKLDVPGNWSGKGQHVEFARNEAIPLEQRAFLGRGALVDVHVVTCQGLTIARKQIYDS